MGIQKDGMYFQGQAYKYQGGSKFDPPETVYIRTEYLGVVTASPAHEDKSQSHTSQSQEHKEVILFLEDEFLAR
jgi:hypothetical protein